MIDTEKLKQKAMVIRSALLADNFGLTSERFYLQYLDWLETQDFQKSPVVQRAYEEVINALSFRGSETEQYCIKVSEEQRKRLQMEETAWIVKYSNYLVQEVQATADWPRPSQRRMAAFVSEETIRDIESANEDHYYAERKYSIEELRNYFKDDSTLKRPTRKKLMGFISREAKSPSGKRAYIKEVGNGQYQLLRQSNTNKKIMTELCKEKRGGSRKTVK